MAMYLGEDKVASLGSICNVSGSASKNLFDAYKYSENKTHTGNVSKYSVINPNEIEVSYINGWSRLVLTLTGLEPNTDYTISAYLDKSNFSTSVGSGFYALDNYQDNAITKGSGNVYFTFTSSSTGTFDMWFYGNWSGTNYSGSVIYKNIQLEKGSTATSYEAYFEPTILIRNSNGIFQEIPNNDNLTVFALTAGNNITIDSQYCYKIGKVVHINCSFTPTASIAMWAVVLGGAPPTTYSIPVVASGWTDSVSSVCLYEYDGGIQNRQALTSGRQYRFSMTYIIP